MYNFYNYLKLFFVLLALLSNTIYSQVPEDSTTSDSNLKKAIDSINQNNLESINKLVAKLDSLENKDKIFQFGLGIGYRTLTSDDENLFINATISTKDSTLKLQKRHRQDLVLSGVLMAYPFNDSSRICGINFCNLGFIANINLAQINEESISFSNSVIQ